MAHEILNKKPFLQLDPDNFTGIKLIGEDNCFKRYKTVVSVLKNRISPEYVHFVAEPWQDVLTGNVFYYTENWTEYPVRLSSMSGGRRDLYLDILEKTKAHYEEAKEACTGDDRYVFQCILSNVSEDNVYCFDNKVVLAPWGMRLSANKDYDDVVVRIGLPVEFCKIVYRIDPKYGSIDGAYEWSCKIKKGSVATAAHIPPLPTVGDEYVFDSWSQNIEGRAVDSDMEITAVCPERVAEDPLRIVRFEIDSQKGKFANGDDMFVCKVRQGEDITPSQVPDVIANDGYSFVGWSKSLPFTVESDVVLTAVFDEEVAAAAMPVYHTVTFSVKKKWGALITADGERVEVIDKVVEDGCSLYDRDIPEVEANKGYTFQKWSEEIVAQPIHEDKEIEAVFDREPWWKRFWAWLTGFFASIFSGFSFGFNKGCLKRLLWLLLILLILGLLAGLGGCGPTMCSGGGAGSAVGAGGGSGSSGAGDANGGGANGGVGDANGGGANGGAPSSGYNPGNPSDIYITPPLGDGDLGGLPPTQGGNRDLIDGGKSPLPQRPYLPPIAGGDGKLPPIVREPGRPDVLEGRLVVFFENETDDMDQWVKEFKEIYPGDKHSVVGSDRAARVLMLEIPEAERNTIRETLPQRLPTYKFFIVDEQLISSHSKMSKNAKAKEGWHISEIRIEEAHTVTKGKDSIIIAVVDDGCDMSHPMFSDRVVKPYNIFSQTADVKKGDAGHGTHVAGIALGSDVFRAKGALGVAPKCKLMPVQVYDGDHTITSALVCGIMYALHNGASVINVSSGMSLSGVASLSEAEQRNLANNFFKNEAKIWNHIAEIAKKKSAIIVYAAGNDHILSKVSATNRSLISISVSATGPNGVMTEFSNYGEGSDVSAPGLDIVSAKNGGGVVAMSGTSMSAPIISGTVALLKSLDAGINGEEALAVITSCGTKAKGGDIPVVVDVAAAVGYVKKKADDVAVSDGGNANARPDYSDLLDRLKRLKEEKERIEREIRYLEGQLPNE